ncbi:MAG TPA: EAL domain-containing protein [Noviherbaspirillum sp.]|uniref:putative bifunctional diguanylate cyclase/phosphodiesterase n=1 Tax=Noviherbaspirillum sp. TaxID=1926288 RepID=UPI002D5660D4|nr:EAL domain-containing protein [Noviherbaspirillum sp.]HYD94701.1 EAL domain-containing protein [Noviherbaspirillum sp.]
MSNDKEQRGLSAFIRSSRKSELCALFQTLGEGAAVGEIVLSSEGNVVDVQLDEFNSRFKEVCAASKMDTNACLLSTVCAIPVEPLLAQCEQVFRHGDFAESEQYSPFNDQWYRVQTVRSSGRTMLILMSDITNRKHIEHDLHESRERFFKIVSQAATGVVEADASGQMTLINQKFCHMLNYTEEELLGKSVLEITAPESLQETTEAVATLMAGAQDTVIEKQYIRKDGSLMWAKSSVSALRDTDGHYQGLVAIVVDISDHKLAEARVMHAALHDPLTGLPNRAMLAEYSNHLLPHNERNGTTAAVLFLDLDRFKPINDRHGHDVGDKVLRAVARRLHAGLRADDLVIRLGGDEFVVFLQDIKDGMHASEVASHIIQHINQPIDIDNITLALSTSIGISIFPSDGKDIETLLRHADMAMYQAKQSGRNRFQFYSLEYAAAARFQLEIEHRLRSTVSASGFHLCYQPVVELQTGKVVSTEALLRWGDLTIGPSQFVPIAEATGLINEIGVWLLQEAIKQHQDWISQGMPPIPIAINVSAVEFRSPDLVERFRSTLQQQGAAPNALQLEVTETAVMDDVEHAVHVLSRLKADGIKILLDDFGTGYSSLSHLAKLPLNKVKIDKSFVTPAKHDVACRAVTNAMISLGRTLNLEVIAEGVESEQTLAYVQSQGCTQAQGFYLAHPMSGHDFARWYQDRCHPGA